MGAFITWTYCEKCGRAIRVGEICFDIGEDSYCTDCCKEVNTLDEYAKEWGDGNG